MTSQDRLSFWSGFAAGVAALAGGVQALVAALLTPSIAGTLKEFQARCLPLITTIATSRAWSWGSAFAIALAVVATIRIGAERARTRVAILVAALAIAVVAFTLVASYWPLWQLSDNIRAE